VSSIIIFGGSRGIGKIIAEYLISGGHEVSVASRNYQTLHKFKKDISTRNLLVHVVAADITCQKDVTKVFQSHIRKWHKIPDAVINCAAIQGPIGLSWNIHVKKWEATVRTNLLGSFIVAKVAINQMIKQGHGSIIMFSGGGSVYGRPYFSAYGVSKTGILRMVETLAEELRIQGYPDIIINAVAPGAVKTNMTSEVLRAGPVAGTKALAEANEVFQKGGTSVDEITMLIDFLINLKANCSLTGRLIHVREDYRGLIRKYAAEVPEDIGKIRRVPISTTK